MSPTPHERSMLICVSDIHLTDALHGSHVTREETFERFWTRISAARGERPAHICFVGDLFDLVRSPRWLDGAFRPYHDPDTHVQAVVLEIVERIVAREQGFFDAIRRRVEEGGLEVSYLLGNHDRLFAHCPEARRVAWRALTGRDEDVEFRTEQVFPDHGVLAYHGHLGDPVNESLDGGGTIGDALGVELITRFPRMMRRIVGEEGSAILEDIDDVRPIYAVPSWVRHVGVVQKALLRPVNRTWAGLVEDFLSKRFVRQWIRSQRKGFRLDTGKKLELMLQLSTKRLVARGQDQRLTKLYKVVQHGFDGRMAARAVEQLSAKKGLRFVVNGHSHFASMVPLGSIDGRPAAYFNTGTWRTVHQIGNALGGRPSFLAYDAMTYLVFFPSGDPLGRDYEWWTGAMVPWS
ncbi:MAG: hypothetical protein GXP55_10355 [Deltaproteobacteria bacterium]|nr:hypothetical protein [Deltaproteobacteria bacterium]